MELILKLEEVKKAVLALTPLGKPNEELIESQLLIRSLQSDFLEFLLTNGREALSYRIEVATGTFTDVAVPFVKFKSFICALPEFKEGVGVNNIELSLINSRLLISVSNVGKNHRIYKSCLNLTTTAAFKIPIPKAFKEPSFILDSTAFLGVLDKVASIVNPDILMTSLRGVLLEVSNKKVTLVSTNGALLIEGTSNITNSDVKCKLLITYNTAIALSKLTTYGSKMFVEVSDTYFNVQVGHAFLFGRFYRKASFPDYFSYLSDYSIYIDIEKQYIMQAIKPVLSELEKDDLFRTTLTISSGILKFTSGAFDIEYGEVDTSEDLIMDLNCRDFFNALAKIRTFNVTLGYNTVNPDKLVMFSKDSPELTIVLASLKRV